jgi:hypothetical protein
MSAAYASTFEPSGILDRMQRTKGKERTKTDSVTRLFVADAATGYVIIASTPKEASERLIGT